MKNNYKKTIKQIMTSMVFLLSVMLYSQDIHFTFANSQNTNDGANDFYEVDVMIQTINSTGTFKLGDGQLYFNYNTAAFGDNIGASGGFEVTYANPDYICGQFVDAGAASVYGGFVTNDNLVSRVSWAFEQTFSSTTFAADNVTETPTKLARLKIQYTNVLEDPMVVFEDDAAFIDQFYTACGSAAPDTGFNTADCTGFPGVQLLNDTYDSTGAVLSNEDVDPLLGVSIYPNPTSDVINISSTIEITSLELFNILGKKVMVSKSITDKLSVSELPMGIYLLRIDTVNGGLTKKIIIE